MGLGQKKGLKNNMRLLNVAIALGSVAALPTLQAFAATSTSSITLGTTTLSYGYSGPLSISLSGTGTQFVQGESVVYVLNSNGTDTHAATNFQVSSPYQMTFTLASGLGNPSANTTYIVEEETPLASGGVEIDKANLTVVAPTGQDNPQSLPGNYKTGTTVNLVTTGLSLTSSATVQLINSSGTNESAYLSGSPVIQGQTAQVTLMPNLAPGSYSFVVMQGSVSVKIPFSITGVSPSITTTQIPGVTTGQTNYSYSLHSDGTGPITWSSTNLPQWLSLSSSGTLTIVNGRSAPSTAVQIPLQVTATNAYGTNAQILTLVVTSPNSVPVITTSALPDATIGQTNYSATLSATPATGVTWTVSNLPSWLKLDASTGVLTLNGNDVPVGSVTTNLQVSVKNAYGSSSVKLIPLTIQPAVVVTGSGTTNPGTTNPGTTNPGTMNPGTTNPGTTNPGTTNPGTTNPGTTNPSTQLSTIVAQQTETSSGGVITKSFGNSKMNVKVMPGTFSGAVQITVSAENQGSLSSFLSQLNSNGTSLNDRKIPLLPGIPVSSVPLVLGVNFSGEAPTKPITITLNNPAFTSKTLFFDINATGQLVPIHAIVSAGQALLHVASDTHLMALLLQSNQRVLTMPGQTQVLPALIQKDPISHVNTTFIPIWYLMQVLKKDGLTSTWNGKTWSISTSGSIPFHTNGVKVGQGDMNISLDGNVVEHVPGTIAKDPLHGNHTTFMPIWYVMQVLNHLGINSRWNGETWSLNSATVAQSSTQ